MAMEEGHTDTTASSSRPPAASGRPSRSRKKKVDAAFEWGGDEDDDDGGDDERGQTGDALEVPSKTATKKQKPPKPKQTKKANGKDRKRATVDDDDDEYEPEEEIRSVRMNEDGDEEDEGPDEEEEEEDDEAAIHRRQLLFQALDSAVISSGMLEQNDLHQLSLVCQALCLSVRQRIRSVSGVPAILSELRQHFPGARQLTVAFRERFIPADYDPDVSPTGSRPSNVGPMIWRVPSSLMEPNNQITISQIQSLTIRTEVFEGYQAKMHLDQQLLLLTNGGGTGGKSKKKQKKQKQPKKNPMAGFQQVHDPFLFMLPFIPQGLTSLSLELRGNPTSDHLLTSLSHVLHQAPLSSLQHLTIDARVRKGPAVIGAVWPAIEEGKFPRLQSLHLMWETPYSSWTSNEALLGPPVTKLLLGLGSREYLRELRSVVLVGELGANNLACLLDAPNLDLTRFQSFYITDDKALTTIPRFLSATDSTWDLQTFGATLLTSPPPRWSVNNAVNRKSQRDVIGESVPTI